MSRLLPYSPVLNPVERVFQELRRELRFRVFETLEEAESYVGEVPRRIYQLNNIQIRL